MVLEAEILMGATLAILLKMIRNGYFEENIQNVKKSKTETRESIDKSSVSELA